MRVLGIQCKWIQTTLHTSRLSITLLFYQSKVSFSFLQPVDWQRPRGNVGVKLDWFQTFVACEPQTYFWNWSSAVKLRQIQQISSPDGKIHRWNAQMKSGSWRKYWAVVLKEKSQKIKRQIFPGWINHCFPRG